MTAKKAPARPTPAQVTPISAWKKSAAGVPMTLPSGNVAIVRNPGMQAFVTAGVIPNSLMPIVRDAIDKHKAPQLDEVIDNPEMLRDITVFMDKVVMHCVTEPKIHEVVPDNLREDDKLYVDEVNDDDKSFIFQFAVGGTSDLETFRLERAKDLATVAGVPEPSSETLRTAGA